MALAGQAPQAPPAEMSLPSVPGAEPTASPGQMSAPLYGIQQKMDEEWQKKVAVTFSRWTEILDRSLERVFERQQRVVLEKASGAKAKKQLGSGGSLDIDSIFTLETWAKQMDEDIRPVLSAIINDAQETYIEKSLVRSPLKKEDIMAHLDAQMSRIKAINIETADEISNAIFSTLTIRDEEERAKMLRSAIVSTFTNLMDKKKNQVAENESRRAWSIGSQI